MLGMIINLLQCCHYPRVITHTSGGWYLIGFGDYRLDFCCFKNQLIVLLPGNPAAVTVLVEAHRWLLPSPTIFRLAIARYHEFPESCLELNKKETMTLQYEWTQSLELGGLLRPVAALVA